MMAKIARLIPVLFAGAAAAAAVALAPAANADPPPAPPCTNAYGSPCSGIGNINAGGSADGGGASGGFWNGPTGAANRGGASACLPNVGCLSIPAP